MRNSVVDLGAAAADYVVSDSYAQGGIVGQLGELSQMSTEFSDELSQLVNGGSSGNQEFGFTGEGYSGGTSLIPTPSTTTLGNGPNGMFGASQPAYQEAVPDRLAYNQFKNTLRQPGDMGRYVAPGEDMSFQDYMGFGQPSNLTEANNAGYGMALRSPQVDQGFFDSQEFNALNPNRAGTADMYDSRYFGSMGSGSLGRSQEDAYENYLRRTGQEGSILQPDNRNLVRTDMLPGGSGSGGFGQNIFGFQYGGDVPLPDELAYTQGMNNPVQMPEEAGIGSFMYDMVTGSVPSDKYNAMRTSGRMDDPMAQAIYGQDPTFMEQLVKRYNYPANIPMEDAEGFAIMDSATGMQKKMMATDMGLPEYMRTGRPRQDFPTYGELEDARAHGLASMMMAKDYGPKTTSMVTRIKEATEALPGFGSSTFKDIKMDNRNNAVGVSLLKKAGINSTPRQLARIVDEEVFNQLDVIMDRTPTEQTTPAKDQPFAKQNFKSPEGGLDVYFPRDRDGYFDTSYIYDSGKMPRAGRD